MKKTDYINTLKGIGEKTEQLFHKLHIYTIKDLLEHYPRTYDVYGDIVCIRELKEEEMAIIEVSLETLPKITIVRNLKIISCMVKDRTGKIAVTWFNMPFLKNQLRLGRSYLFRGKIIKKKNNLIIEQPQILTKEEVCQKRNQLQPVYSLTMRLTNKTMEKVIRQVLEQMEWEEEYIPNWMRTQYQLCSYQEAMTWIHFPENPIQLAQAKRRIIFEEFFFFSLSILQTKEENTKAVSIYQIERKEEVVEYIHSLPFPLTTAQKRVWNEIEQDLTGVYVMNRLVQGDVGSGKTVLAAMALLEVAKNGYQTCLMVPTEVLAKQHFALMEQPFLSYGVSTILLVGSMTAKEKKRAAEQIQNHEIDVIIGTHALIQEYVQYDNLALVITDEQHRFGVKQRESLYEKGKKPHVLVMSATPIPRTLAIILYGDLDSSVLDELPAKRLAIKNCVVDTSYRKKAYQFIQEQISQHHQAYIICPMVEESEQLDAENVMEYTMQLQQQFPSHITIQYLHGKMKAKEKNEQMERFAKGEIDVLVSTTVVEVGVNVPNATIMMIENAERFGLAQLHQLRGRVGRGEVQSYCILICGKEGKKIRERLEILNHSNDGFYIANEDLKLRGPGDLFGIKQSGELSFKMGDIYNDAALLLLANDAAKQYWESKEKNLCLIEKITEKIGQMSL